MLQANYGGHGIEQPAEYTAFSLRDLGEVVGRLAASPPLSSLFPAACGDHAWLSVIDRGFILHAYFGEAASKEGVIGFELYGPHPVGEERAHGDPFDGRGLTGSITTRHLKEVLGLLDRCHCPVEYVMTNAISVTVVRDD